MLQLASLYEHERESVLTLERQDTFDKMLFDAFRERYVRPYI